MNNVSLIGRLVADPTTRSVGDNLTVCNFTLAFDKKKKDAGANFIDCSAWNSTAKYLGEYAKKGTQVALQGFLDHQIWEKDGKKGSKIQLVVNEAKMVGNGGGAKKEEETPSDALDLSNIPFN